MVKYIFIIKKIVVVELIKMFFEKIVLRFGISINIINNREFIFINAY